MDTAKTLLSRLQAVAFEEGEAQMIGPVFVNFAQELCDVYKTYCSNHNLTVQPLISKVFRFTSIINSVNSFF